MASFGGVLNAAWAIGAGITPFAPRRCASLVVAAGIIRIFAIARRLRPRWLFGRSPGRDHKLELLRQVVGGRLLRPYFCGGVWRRP
jgi:hypothetical protein